MTIKQWARAYLYHGWNPIPLAPGSKRPLAAWERYQKEQMTEAEIEKWPVDVNLGIVTGAISKLVIVDVDNMNIGSPFQSPVSVRTGKGIHWYFKHPGEHVKNFVRKDLGYDLRADGGYVVAPPSLHDSGRRYSWLAPWSLPLPPFPSFPAEAGSSYPTSRTPANMDPDWLGEALSSLAYGNRNDTFTRIAGRLKRDKWTADSMYKLLLPHAERVHTTAQELLQIINSVDRYQDSTTFQVWLPKDINDYEKRKSRAVEAIEFPTGFKWIDDKTHGIRRGSIFTVAARTNVGKTTFALTVSQNLCSLGKSVLIFSTENNYQGIWDRYFAIACNLPAFRLENNQLTVPETVRLKTFKEEVFPTHKLAVFDTAVFDFKTIQEVVNQQQPDVLVFDYFQRIDTGEARAAEMAKFARALRNLCNQQQIGALVCAQLHDGRPDMRTGKVPSPSLIDIKECKTLADESTTVALLDWDRTVATDDETANCLFILSKNKGPSGTTLLKLDRSIPKFIQ